MAEAMKASSSRRMYLRSDIGEGAVWSRIHGSDARPWRIMRAVHFEFDREPILPRVLRIQILELPYAEE